MYAVYSVVPSIFGGQQLHYLAVIKQMLVQALRSPTKEVLLLDCHCAGYHGNNTTGMDGSYKGNSSVCDAS